MLVRFFEEEIEVEQYDKYIELPMYLYFNHSKLHEKVIVEYVQIAKNLEITSLKKSYYPTEESEDSEVKYTIKNDLLNVDCCQFTRDELSPTEMGKTDAKICFFKMLDEINHYLLSKKNI